MDYNHTSLCIVTHRDNAQNGLRQKMLARVADYNADVSSLVPCNIIDYLPKTFNNRDMLYARDEMDQMLIMRSVFGTGKHLQKITTPQEIT